MLLRETNIETFDFGFIIKKLWGSCNVVWIQTEQDPHSYVAIFLEKEGKFLFYDWVSGCCKTCNTFDDLVPWANDEILKRRAREGAHMFNSAKEALEFAEDFVSDAVDELCTYVLNLLPDTSIENETGRSNSTQTSQLSQSDKTTKPRLLKIDGKYKHYKTGDVYTVVGVANHTEQKENLVIYTRDSLVWWARPYDMFLDEVSPGVQRFELIKETKNA